MVLVNWHHLVNEEKKGIFLKELYLFISFLYLNRELSLLYKAFFLFQFVTPINKDLTKKRGKKSLSLASFHIEKLPFKKMLKWIFFGESKCLLCTNLGWKIHRLTKIISWNVTKWSLFFNIVPPFLLVVCALFPFVLQCLDPIGQKNHLQLIWYHHWRFSAHPHILV